MVEEAGERRTLCNVTAASPARIQALENVSTVSNHWGVNISMQPNASCQPNETEIFSTANIRQCRRYVRSIQRKLDRAVASGDKSHETPYLQWRWKATQPTASSWQVSQRTSCRFHKRRNGRIQQLRYILPEASQEKEATWIDCESRVCRKCAPCHALRE